MDPRKAMAQQLSFGKMNLSLPFARPDRPQRHRQIRHRTMTFPPGAPAGGIPAGDKPLPQRPPQDLARRRQQPHQALPTLLQGEVRDPAHLEQVRRVRIVRRSTGQIARVILHRLPGDPRPFGLADYLGTRYSHRQHLADGHECWQLRAPGDKPSETDLAPEGVRAETSEAIRHRLIGGISQTDAKSPP